MQWLLDNWIIVLLVAGFIGMHLFGHGGHGGHGGGHRRGKHKHDDAETTEDVPDKTQPHSHDDKDADPQASSGRTAEVPGQATHGPKTTDEL